MATEDIRLDDQGDLRDEQEGLLELEHPGGDRFNRLILIAFAVVAIVSGVVVALGVESSGIGQSAGVQKAGEDPGASARNNGEIADLAAHGGNLQHRLSYRLPLWSRPCKRRSKTHRRNRPAVTRSGRKRST